MAIVVEEERPRVNMMQVLMWAIVLVVVGVAVYYIFFARPEVVDIIVPSAFVSVDPLAEITLNPEDLINSKAFNDVNHQYVPLPSPGNAGRSNPFLSPQ